MITFDSTFKMFGKTASSAPIGIKNSPFAFRNANSKFLGNESSKGGSSLDESSKDGSALDESSNDEGGE